MRFREISWQLCSGTEKVSNIRATIINRIVYASLESPNIAGESSVNFHIDWCPHQDHYGAFDCRVQRYFVQGMIDAAMEFLLSQGRTGRWDVMFKCTIPAGAETCYFEMHQGDSKAAERWRRYTEILENRALRPGSEGGASAGADRFS